MALSSNTRESKHDPLADICYIDPNGNMTDIKLNLKKDADNTRLQKTVYWAICNNVEIRIRPSQA